MAKPDNKTKLVCKYVFNDERFSLNFCYFDKPIIEYTLEQQVSLLSERFSRYEIEKLYDIVKLYKNQLRDVQIKPNEVLHRGEQIGTIVNRMTYRVHFNNHAIKMKLDGLSKRELNRKIGFYAPKIALAEVDVQLYKLFQDA